jgi:hypothetical protein
MEIKAQETSVLFNLILVLIKKLGKLHMEQRSCADLDLEQQLRFFRAATSPL